MQVLDWLADYERDRVVLYGYGPPDSGTGDHYYLAYDHGRQHEGRAAFFGVHLHIDPNRTSLRAEMQDQPMPELAENWLASRGADRGRLRRLADDVFLPLGDPESTEVESLLRESGHRFDVVDSRSTQDGDHFQTYAVATDRTPPDPDRPVAAFVSSRTGEAPSRLRAAHFPTREAAAEWIRGAKPLPQPAPTRSEAARLDSRPAGTAQPAAEATPSPPETNRRPHRR
ncbi:hypothetical protein ACFV4P_31080 [Kitasatospora sp. NPDC059795]|uniref:hypothetical protein n=1 Tax=Kitasatospora sp. NPDC059795 TaxID=3346949 RepID=UPI0036466852